MKINKRYLIIWHYMANHGVEIVYGESKEQALEEHPFSKRDDIAMFITEFDNVLFQNTQIKTVK